MEALDRVWRERGLRDAVLAGDEQAWRLWYDESFAGLYAYVLWRCGGLRDHADEVVQDVWLTAVRRLSTFEPESGAFAAWLRGIAAHLLCNHFRRRRRCQWPWRPAREAEEAADANLMRREQAQQVARALARLPEHYERVLRARYLDGQDVASIAEARGLSLKAAESLLGRAREAFRSAYQSGE